MACHNPDGRPFKIRHRGRFRRALRGQTVKRPHRSVRCRSPRNGITPPVSWMSLHDIVGKRLWLSRLSWITGNEHFIRRNAAQRTPTSRMLVVPTHGSVRALRDRDEFELRGWGLCSFDGQSVQVLIEASEQDALWFGSVHKRTNISTLSTMSGQLNLEAAAAELCNQRGFEFRGPRTGFPCAYQSPTTHSNSR